MLLEDGRTLGRTVVNHIEVLILSRAFRQVRGMQVDALPQQHIGHLLCYSSVAASNERKSRLTRDDTDTFPVGQLLSLHDRRYEDICGRVDGLADAKYRVRCWFASTKDRVIFNVIEPVSCQFRARDMGRPGPMRTLKKMYAADPPPS